MVPLPFTTTTPFVGPALVPVTVSVWPASGSESFARTETITGVPLNVEAESLTATGGWLQLASLAALSVTVVKAVPMAPSLSVTCKPRFTTPVGSALKAAVTSGFTPVAFGALKLIVPQLHL